MDPRQALPGGSSRIVIFALLALVGIAFAWWILRQPGPADGKREDRGQAAVTKETPALPDEFQPPDTAANSAPSPAPAATPTAPRAAALPMRKPLGNFSRQQRGPMPPSAAQQAALADLQASLPNVEVQFDAVTGSPNLIMATGRYLTAAAGRAGDGYDAVRQFVNEHAALFGHDTTPLNESRLTREDVTAHNGMRTVVWQQQVDGVPLYHTIFKANVTRDGALVTASSHFLADAEGATQLAVKERVMLMAAPPVDVRQAVSLAAVSLGEQVAPEDVVETGPPDGVEQKQRFSAPQLSDILGQFTWLPLNAGTARLAWDVTLMSLSRREMFRVLVDAQTGDILLRTSLTNDISNASYRVYADGTTLQPLDSPSPLSPGLVTPTSTQPPLASRTLITTPALDTTASPNGWINDGITDTYGNNVDAHLDTAATNPTYGTGTHATSATRVFDFTLDLTLSPATYQSAVVTSLFYACNYYHDKLYALGFTETAGNFQQNNFGRGGVANDAVLADAQDGSGTNNANFSTPADGSPGRMQMYIFTGPTPQRDGDLDMEIVFHEHTHGLSNRLVGGGVGISALQTQGMGEGWSDFYGLCLLSQPGDNVNGNYAAGGYATYQLSGLTSNYYYGIRRYPYSTDLTKNPLTLKDIDPTQASAHSTVPHSPIFSDPTVSSSEVHNQGEVWCVALWEARAGLVNKLGAAAGNQMILQLVTDGMKLSPANPTFLQARNAIIQADLVDNGGANKNELWAAFAKRGMGASASVPANSTTTGIVEAFDIPDNLGVTPAAIFSSSGQIGGPFSPAAQSYTLTNSGAVSLNWTASANQTWLSVSPSSGALAAGASTTVTVTITALANGLSAGNYTGTASFTNVTSGAVLARQTSLAVTPPRVAYFDLTTDPGWTRQGEWAYGTPTGGGGTSFGFHDPTSGATGTKVFGINLSGDYSTTLGGPYYLTTGAINLTNYSGAQLRFKRWLNTDYPSYAYATVQVSNDAVTWTTVFTNVAGTAISDTAWTAVQYDISAVADKHSTVYVRWGHQIGSSGAFAYSGWNIDDVEILGTPATSLALVLSPSSVTEGAVPATATLTASPPPTVSTVVTLTSSDPSSATVPATVIMPAGQSSVTFPVTVIDDAVLNGNRSVLLTASTAGYTSGTATLTVNDNETATLTVTAPASATEGVGSVQGTVSVSAAPASAVAVALTSSDTTALQVPATVTIPAGQTSVNFTIAVIDDTKINGTHAATIAAHVANWTDGTATVNVLDNESTNLVLSPPFNVTEGGTFNTQILISGTLPSALTVALSSDTPSRLTVPATVSIPAGANFATFAVTAPDNAFTDGTAVVMITATATGFTDAGGTVTVLDNDVHHFTVSSIASSQIRGMPFSVTITAKDVNDVTIGSYAGTPGLSAGGDSGADAITPATTAAFSGGVWTGSVTVNSFDTNIVLTVSDGAGHTGASNAFNVATGSLHHFAWNAVASPQAKNVPFGVTVTAQDAGNNTVGGYNGSAALSGTAGSGAGSGIVITEINPNTPDEIEFMNVSTVAVDISGWKVYIYDDDAVWPTPNTLFTIPAGTTCAAGQIFRLQEFGTAPGVFPLFFYGININWTSTSTSHTAVLLRDAAGNAVDFFCAAAGTPASIVSPATIPAAQWSGATVAAPANATFGYARIGSADGNTAADWTTATPGLGTVNPGLVTPFPGANTAVAITPTASGSFVSGAWSGNVTVLQGAIQMKLKADDGAGHVGSSTAFDVVGNPPTVTTLAATAVTGVTATLNGSVNANANTTAVSFSYGLTTSYTTTVAGTPASVAGTSAAASVAALSGLTPGTIYHFRVNGANDFGTTNGGDLTFTTLSNNANLSSLVPSAGTLAPAFSASTTSYTASVPNATTSITVTPTVAFLTATVKVNGVTVASGSASGAISLSVGTNTITTVVTAQDGIATKSYSIAVVRAGLAVPFTSTGTLSAARESHAEVLLGNGKVLVAGGTVADALNSAMATAELYDSATGTWTATGSLATARFHATATLLPNGKVLVVGGVGPTGSSGLSSAELYDPATGVWTATGPLNYFRSSHTATLLGNGKVLVAGGSNGQVLNTGELYDPSLGTWTVINSMNTARYLATAALLPDGKVLVAGGYSNGAVNSSELYDPATGIWTNTTGNMVTARYYHSMTLLPNGKVLLAGGLNGSTAYATTELFDPSLGTWSVSGSMTLARSGHSASLLPSGKLLVAGGSSVSAELYDYVTGTWTATGSLANFRTRHGATLLANGRVLMAAGGTATCELYDSAAGFWTNTTGSLTNARSNHIAKLLPNGKVLVAGGYNGSAWLASTELYDPASGSWTAAGNLANGRIGAAAVLLPTGKVLVAGGYNGSIWLAASELFDPATAVWSPTASLGGARYYTTATLLTNGKVLVAGGYNGSAYLASAELYDPATGTWTPTGSLATARQLHAATLLPNGKVLIVGGYNGSYLASAELYDPASGTWTATGSLATTRQYHSATLLPNGKVLVAGGYNPSSLASSELYNPASGTWTAAGSLTTGRYLHTATLLPNGKVLAVGGYGSAYLASAEMFDPASGTWAVTGNLAASRDYHSATLLPSGRILTAGGYNGSYLASSELYDPGLGFAAGWQPQITATNSPLQPGGKLTLSGSNFRGVSGASSGTARDSSSNFPVVQLRQLEGTQSSYLLSDAGSNWSNTTFVAAPLGNCPPGYALATVFTNGIPSSAAIVNVIVSANANLSGLALSAGTLAPVFASGTTSYTATVLNTTATLSVTPTVADSAATVKVNGTAVASNASASLSLNVGSNTVATVVTAQDGSTTKTYTVVVTRQSPIESWRQTYFGTATLNIGNSEDFDGDGIINLLEFAFGTDPTVSSLGPLQYSGTLAGSGTLAATGQPITVFESVAAGIDYRALFVRRVNYVAAGLTYTVQFSADLQSWTASAAVPTVLANNGTYQIVSVPYPPFVNGRKARFFRVQVSIVP